MWDDPDGPRSRLAKREEWDAAPIPIFVGAVIRAAPITVVLFGGRRLHVCTSMVLVSLFQVSPLPLGLCLPVPVSLSLGDQKIAAARCPPPC
jgi:hypothetical protein